MVAASPRKIRFAERYLGYADACEMARLIAGSGSPGVVHIHLEGTVRTSTAALARLIVLRRTLLQTGQDLCIIGLSGKAEDLYEISRLRKILPRLPSAEA